MIVERSLGANGWQIPYRESGPIAGSPVVLLHAMGTDASDWDAVSEALSDRFRVIAPHQRGFGPGQRLGEYSFESMRDDVLALADALALERFSLVGHSMGGSVAYLVAEQSPWRINRLVIEDTPPPWGSVMPDPAPEPPRPVAFDWEAWRGIARQLKHPDPRWWADLPTISCPTMIVGGGETSHIPQEMLARVARLIPNARHETIASAGHNVHAARFLDFIALVVPFLDESLR